MAAPRRERKGAFDNVTTWVLRLSWFPLLLIVLLSGCATTGSNSETWLRPIYQEKIKDWQLRIRHEGWSENQVHSVLLQFRSMATYRMEVRDHWDTPREFMERGFAGDCKNSAAFEMGALEQLSYPYKVRILIVQSLLENHALLRVELPDGGWKVYDVVPKSVPTRDIRLLRPVVEFDTTTVKWYSSGMLTSSGVRKRDSFTAY